MRSLNRSSRPDEPTAGVACAVNEPELPHNSCTAGETGWVRSPAWNSERKTGAVCCADAVVCAVADNGVTARESGKVES